MSSVNTEYKRADIEGGILTDTKEIAYYKQMQVGDVMENALLGDFNEAGNYVIKKEIITELIKLTKVTQHTYGKSTFCISSKELKEFGFLEFALKIDRTQDKAVASLELLEPINKVGGYYQNINTVLLATYTDAYDLDFLRKVYKAFNIITKEEFQGRKFLIDEETTEIIARKEYLKKLQQGMEKSISEIEKEFFEGRLDALNKGGEKGKAVLLRLQLESKKINKLFLKQGSPQYYQNMNQLLDKVLEHMSQTLDKSILEQMQLKQDQYVQKMQAETIKVKQEMVTAKVMPEQILKAQGEQQSKASTQKSNSVAFSADSFKEKNEVITKVEAIKVEKQSNTKLNENELNIKPVMEAVVNKEERIKGIASNAKNLNEKEAKQFTSEIDSENLNKDAIEQTPEDTKGNNLNEKESIF